jgi:hypothetical protein
MKTQRKYETHTYLLSGIYILVLSSPVHSDHIQESDFKWYVKTHNKVVSEVIIYLYKQLKTNIHITKNISSLSIYEKRLQQTN